MHACSTGCKSKEYDTFIVDMLTYIVNIIHLTFMGLTLFGYTVNPWTILKIYLLHCVIYGLACISQLVMNVSKDTAGYLCVWLSLAESIFFFSIIAIPFSLDFQKPFGQRKFPSGRNPVWQKKMLFFIRIFARHTETSNLHKLPLVWMLKLISPMILAY